MRPFTLWASSLFGLMLLLNACNFGTPAPTPTPTATAAPADTTITTTNPITTAGVTATLPLTTGAGLTEAITTPVTQILTPTATPPLTTTQGLTVSGGDATGQIVATQNVSATIMQVISATPQLQQFAVVLSTSGMAAALQGPGSYTVFAPTDQAFAAIPVEQLTATLNNADALTNLVKYHVVVDQATAAELASLGAALSSTGQPITITVQADSSLTANGARMIQTDIPATNGVIHVIDQVLSPPSQ